MKAFKHAVVASEIFREEFKRDGLSEFEIVCAVDFAHAAAAQEADDAISGGEDSARNKAALRARERVRFREEPGGVVNEGGDETAGGLLMSQEVFNLLSELFIRATLAVEKRSAVVGVALKRRREEGFYSVPTLCIHNQVPMADDAPSARGGARCQVSGIRC